MNIFNPENIQQLHQEKGKFPKMKTVKIKADTPEAQPHVLPESDKIPKRDIIIVKTITHNYNTRSRPKRVNHVETFKNAPKMFQVEAMEKVKTNIGTDHFSFLDPKEEIITA